MCFALIARVLLGGDLTKVGESARGVNENANLG